MTPPKDYHDPSWTKFRDAEIGTMLDEDLPVK